MITCQLILCAENIIRDSETDLFSVFNILEVIRGVGFPLFINRLDILAFFEREADDSAQYDITFVISLGETEILQKQMAIDFEDKFRNRATFRIRGLVIPNPGILKVNTKFQEQILGDYRIAFEQEIQQIETQQNSIGKIRRT